MLTDLKSGGACVLLLIPIRQSAVELKNKMLKNSLNQA